MFSVLLGATSLLLQELTEHEAVTVATHVMNRPHPDVQRTVGLFASTVDLPLAVPREGSVHDYLSAVARVGRESLAHQALTWPLYRREAEAGRAAPVPPVRPLTLTLQPRLATFALAGTRLEPMELDTGVGFPVLSLTFFDDVTTLRGKADFALDLWDEPTQVRIRELVVQILKAMGADLRAPAADV